MPYNEHIAHEIQKSVVTLNLLGLEYNQKYFFFKTYNSSVVGQAADRAGHISKYKTAVNYNADVSTDRDILSLVTVHIRF